VVEKQDVLSTNARAAIVAASLHEVFIRGKRRWLVAGALSDEIETRVMMEW
jgi:hypothetical protein